MQTTTVEDAVKDGLKVDISELKKTISDPQVWKQEFMCWFAADYAALLDTDVLIFEDTEVKESYPHWCGVDIGSSNDNTAIVDLVQLPDQTLFVKDITMMHKATYEH